MIEDMDLWERYLNIYAQAISTHCEKPLGFISEPVNTVSNIAFFISAFFIYKLINKHKLFYLVVLLGLGSIAYHTFNTPYTLILDVLPMYAFILYSLYILTFQWLIPLSLVLIQILVLSNMPAFILDIPTLHITNLLFIGLLVIWLYKRLGKMALKLIPVVAVYGLAIAIRGFDMPICPINKFGSHFLWHILTALTLYLTVKILVEMDQIHQ